MSADRGERGLGVLGAVGALLAVVVCCAGPVLFAGGVLGAVVGLLRNPLIIAAGLVVLAAAVGYAVHLNHRRNAGSRDSCYLPGGRSPEDRIDTRHRGSFRRRSRAGDQNHELSDRRR